MPASCVGGTALPSLGALTMHGASSPLSWQRLPPHELSVLREAGKGFLQLVQVPPEARVPKEGVVDFPLLKRCLLAGRHVFLART